MLYDVFICLINHLALFRTLVLVFAWKPFRLSLTDIGSFYYDFVFRFSVFLRCCLSGELLNVLQLLRQFYRQNKYPTAEEKKQIAERTNLTFVQVRSLACHLTNRHALKLPCFFF